MAENPIFSYLDEAMRQKASDLHLKSSVFPTLRIAGELCPIPGEPPMESEVILDFLEKATEVRVEEWLKGIKAADFSISYKGLRLRGNAYRDNNGISVALRLLDLIEASFEELNIPSVLKQLAQRRSGLVLITGPTGSGKTTTLTYLLEHVNQTQSRHIIMLEDPIEYLHVSARSLFSQREIGRDTPSFSAAITEAMREDPDIIMIGEMRDQLSIEAGLRAAETGHLVFSTLHTRGAVSSVSRIVDVFPAEQQNQIRTQLGMVLLGVVSQQLVPGTQRGKRHLATEVMLANDPIKALIKQNRLHMITSTIQTGRNEGMHTMRASLEALHKAGKISKENMESYQI